MNHPNDLPRIVPASRLTIPVDGVLGDKGDSRLAADLGVTTDELKWFALTRARNQALQVADSFLQAGNLREYDRAYDEFAQHQADLQAIGTQRAHARHTPTLPRITTPVRRIEGDNLATTLSFGLENLSRAMGMPAPTDDDSPAMLAEQPEPAFLEADGPIEPVLPCGVTSCRKCGHATELQPAEPDVGIPHASMVCTECDSAQPIEPRDDDNYGN